MVEEKENKKEMKKADKDGKRQEGSKGKNVFLQLDKLEFRNKSTNPQQDDTIIIGKCSEKKNGFQCR